MVHTLPWVRNLIGFYEARELVDFDSLQEVPAWLERGLARPAVQHGLSIQTGSALIGTGYGGSTKPSALVFLWSALDLPKTRPT
jgi:hypothetical protein